MNRTARITTALLAALAVVSTAACTGGGKVASNNGSDAKQQKVVSGGTFTLGVSSDPGNLDPQRSIESVNEAIASLAYDTPVILSKANQLQPGVVTKWEETTPTTWLLTVRSGVTCSDGSAMDATVIADNLNYVADKKNSNPYAGLAVPVGSTATAHVSAHTVTVKLPAPQSFLMQNLAGLPLVCAKGLASRASLASASNGSGPFVISNVAAGDHIDFGVRKGYDWGPPGQASTSAAGIPAKVVVKIVSSATTTANLVLNGQLNAATVNGTDQKRLQARGLFSTGLSYLSDQVWFNHTKNLPTADPEVRKALIMGLDMKQVIAADTGGLGTPATGQLGNPKICPGNTLSGNLPTFDLDQAKAQLTADGWTVGSGGTRTKDGRKLAIALAYSSDQTGATSASQVLASEWKQLGIEVRLQGKPAQQLVSGILGAKLAWDVTVLGVGVPNPAQMVPFVSGEVAPKGLNFSFIDNADYNSFMAKASAEPGTQGCADWNAAESALFKNGDVVPTGQTPALYYGKNATFDVSGNNHIFPTTIRMH